MALAVVLGVIFGYIRKRDVDLEGGAAPPTREFLAANTLFYGFLFVGILFFGNWFSLLSPDFTGAGADTVSLVWGFIDAALPLLSGAMGLSLLRRRQISRQFLPPGPAPRSCLRALQNFEIIQKDSECGRDPRFRGPPRRSGPAR